MPGRPPPTASDLGLLGDLGSFKEGIDWQVSCAHPEWRSTASGQPPPYRPPAKTQLRHKRHDRADI
jgi:hypothetical protein